MLTSVELKNFKGQTTVQELTGMDIFVGRNGAGKTTRLQALGLAILGYVPGNKRTSTDTFKLATGDAMSVGLKTDKFQLTRNFNKTEKRNARDGSVSVTIKENILVSPGAAERTDTEKNIRIQSEIGHFPVMMDFSEFLNLSDTKRRDFIYSLGGIDSATWTRDRIYDYLTEKLLTDELQANNAEQYDYMLDIINKAIAEFPTDYGVQEGLQAMLSWIDTEKKVWDRKQKDAQGAVRQISDMKNDMAETDRNIATLKQELEKFQQQLIDTEKLMTAEEEKKKAAEKRTARMIELQKAVLELETKPGKADTSDIDRQLREHQLQLAEPPAIDTAIQQLKTRQAEIRQQRKGFADEQQKVANQIATVQATVVALEEALKTTGDIAGRCVINPKLIKCDKDFSGFGEYVDRKKSEAADSVAELLQQEEALKKSISKLDDEETDISNKQSELLKQVQEVNTRNTSINKTIATLSEQRNSLLAEVTDRENKIKLYREELDRILNEPAAAPFVVSLDTQADEIRSRISVNKKIIEEKEKAKQTILLMQQSMMDNRKAEYQSSCLKLIAEALGPKGVQGEIVKECLEPIRQNIQGNLALMGFYQEPFFQTESDTGKEIFQFGWINEKGHYVNFDALSTGQQTVFLAAMMVTIIDRAQPKLRLLAMDNLNHLDRRNFQLLIDGLTKVKDKLDNIILAGAIEFDFAADGWQVWNLSQQSEVMEVKQSA
ncbi:hypothetical protein KIAC18_003957 [Sporomusa sphaeroides]|uniref:ATP-binding protein n=1 Tax=Sporomusa sphaeroides TaxID=47679 RepID=UPI003DA0EB6C